MQIQHSYQVRAEWQGNRGTGTSDYKSYGREVLLSVAGKPDIEGSADHAFRGNAARWNPEDMLLAALSECHLLSYLHAAATHGIVVIAYTDSASAVMEQTADGGGHFVSATLRPVVTISAGDPELAQQLHEQASAQCFIAASVNFPVLHEPTVRP